MKFSKYYIFFLLRSQIRRILLLHPASLQHSHFRSMALRNVFFADVGVNAVVRLLDPVAKLCELQHCLFFSSLRADE